MLIDCHSHTPGISICCKSTIEEIIAVTKNVGIDGIVLTNHYSNYYIKDKGLYPDFKSLARCYAEESRKTKEIGKQNGFKVFFGMEASMENYGRTHMLIYGVEEDFLERHAELCFYTQEELYRAVHDNGGIMVQAHPMRKGKNVLLDPKFLDGVEISSCVFYDGTYYDQLSEFADKNRLILTVGGDYHGGKYRTHCGMYIPDSIENEKQFVQYLRTADSFRLLMQETEDTESFEKIFYRNKLDKGE